MRAVAPTETIDVHGHLLTFQRGSNAPHEDNLVVTLQFTNNLLIVYETLRADVHLEAGTIGGYVGKANLDGILLAGLYLDGRTGRRDTPRGMTLLHLTIDQHLEVADRLHIDDHFPTLAGTEDSLVGSTEIREVDTGSKLVVARSRLADRTLVVLRRHGFSLTLDIVPESTLDTRLSLKGELVEEGCEDAVVREVASLEILDLLVELADALQYGDGCGRRTVVVTPHERLVIGIGANDGHLLTGLERQDAVPVLEQGHGLACHVEGQLQVFLALQHTAGNLAPLHKGGVVHLTQVETAFEQADDVLVNLTLLDEVATYGLRKLSIVIIVTTLHIGTGQGRTGRGMYGIRSRLVAGMNVGDGTTVTHHKVLEPPLITQDLLQQTLVRTAGLVIQTLVGTHHLTHLGILHQGLEGRQVSFVHVTGRDLGEVGRMATPLRSAVYGIVLGTGPCLAVLGILRPLKTAHHSAAHLGSEIGILSIGLLSASPTWVTEDVDIGSPVGQGMEARDILAAAQEFIPLGPSLGADGIEDTLDQRGIERGGHAYGFREIGDIAHVGHTVQGFAPPLETLDAQPGNGRGIIEHEGGLLLQRQTAAEIDGTLMGREVGILIGIGLR